MRLVWNRALGLGLCALVVTVSSTFGRNAADPVRPDGTGQANYGVRIEFAGHNVGKITLGIWNNGQFGIYQNDKFEDYDKFTGQPVAACEYPKGSKTRYLFAGVFWIGAVVGRDTLVSTGADGWTPPSEEFYPDQFGVLKKRSIKDPSSPEFAGAISEQDYIAVYCDTFTTSGGGVSLDNDGLTGRPHKPIGIEVTQRSYAWSYSYAEDFVLFDYSIRNIGNLKQTNVYMGFYVDGDVHSSGKDSQNGASDDLTGFVFDLPTPPEFSAGCPFRDTVYIAWIADNDGDPDGTTYGATSVPNVTAMRIVRTPQRNLDVSYNWWVSNGDAARDFGPQGRRTFREMGVGNTGTPVGDVSKYHLLRNKEFDYDQIYTASIAATDTNWVYPANRDIASDISDGFDTRYLLSFGPFNIDPGQTLPLSFAYLGGEGFHTNPKNAADNLPGNPAAFYANLGFKDLGLNSMWASWIYDNPGVDTDSDGYAGKMRICPYDSVLVRVDTIVVGIDTTFNPIYQVTEADSLWYEGDGVPDFKGASPPPPPRVWLYPTVENGVGKVRVRWNGVRSETTRDVFSKLLDFEGYRVYVGRDNRSTSFSLCNSYDRKDFTKWVYNPRKLPAAGYDLYDPPFSLQELQRMYGHSDTTWNPLDYTRNQPYIKVGPPDSMFYFASQDNNASDYGVNTQIRKIYGDTLRYPKPPDTLLAWSVDSVPANLPDTFREKYFTDDNYLKYYEYEYTLQNLLPTVPYWVSVTTFDFGSPKEGLEALESSVIYDPLMSYALPDADEVKTSALKAYCYPNPYRINGGYRAAGFEGRGQLDRPDDRVRQVHFANLPAKCTIKIFTLDGDIVRQIDHDVDPSDPNASHETWNLITRNTQLVVSGIYYWTVEEPGGKIQINKLVIIM